MFLPIGDSPNEPQTPWVTYGLIAVNVLVFLAFLPQQWSAANLDDPAARDYLQTLVSEGRISLTQARALASQLTGYDLVVFRHGFRPGAPALVDAISGMFLHGGWMHLIGNMLFLWIYGDNVEHRLGKLGFLAAYLGTGLAATAGDGLLRWGSGVPSVGASGAISGVLGFYFLWFPRNTVRVWVFLFPLFANVVELPARLVLGMYLVLDNLLPLLFSGGQGGVSYGAHIGGFIAGLALAVPLDRRLGSRHVREYRAARRATPAAASDVGLRDGFRSALERGEVVEAAQLLFGSPRPQTRRALDDHDKVRLGEALERAGQSKAALAAYQRALADHPTGTARASAHLGAARVLIRAFGFAAAAYQHLYAVLEESDDESERSVARAMLDELESASISVPRRRRSE